MADSAAATTAALLASVRSQPTRTEAEEILSRMPVVMETIEREYADYNTKHSTRKQKRVVPALFYSFYQSPVCTNFILAMHEYLVAFLRAPIQEGEGRTVRTPNGREVTNTKLQTLSQLLSRVSETWSAILMFRADMNRFETITITKTMKKSEHFLNDTFDYLFFETLVLLVEYTLEFRFMDQHSPQNGVGSQLDGSSSASGGGGSGLQSAKQSPSSSSPPIDGGAIQTTVPVPPTTVIVKPAKLPPPGSTEAQWRIAQHELQRLLRSRNFSFSMKQHAPDRTHPHGSRGNGLNHLPLGTNQNHASAAATAAGGGGGSHSSSSRSSKAASSKSSTAYRNPATFSLFGVRRWNDPPIDIDDLDDTRALSHLPGQFHTKGQQSILDCLDLRSPLVAAVLPNPRSMVASNEKYVYGTEERRANAKRRYHGRLTHAEEKYLTEQHAKQAKKEEEWRLRLEREAREEQEQEELEARRLEEQRLRHLAHNFGETYVGQESGEMKPPEESKEQVQGGNAASLHSTVSLHDAPPPIIPALRLSHPNPPSSARPLPPPLHHHHTSSSSIHSSSGGGGGGTLTQPPGTGGSRSSRFQASVNGIVPPGSQTARFGRLAPLLHPSSAAGAQTARRATLDEKLADPTRRLIKLDGNRISLVDFDI